MDTNPPSSTSEMMANTGTQADDGLAQEPGGPSAAESVSQADGVREEASTNNNPPDNSSMNSRSFADTVSRIEKFYIHLQKTEEDTSYTLKKEELSRLIHRKFGFPKDTIAGIEQKRSDNDDDPFKTDSEKGDNNGAKDKTVTVGSDDSNGNDTDVTKVFEPNATSTAKSSPVIHGPINLHDNSAELSLCKQCFTMLVDGKCPTYRPRIRFPKEKQRIMETNKETPDKFPKPGDKRGATSSPEVENEPGPAGGEKTSKGRGGKKNSPENSAKKPPVRELRTRK